MSTERSLLAFDTNHIKEYVFATDRLKEIRAASAHLEELNTQVMPNIVHKIDPSKEQIYAYGGAGLFEVGSSKVHQICLAVEETYKQRTGRAVSITGAVLELPENTSQNYGELIQLLQLKLRLNKDRPLKAKAITSLPFLRHCQSCGKFMIFSLKIAIS